MNIKDFSPYGCKEKFENGNLMTQKNQCSLFLPNAMILTPVTWFWGFAAGV